MTRDRKNRVLVVGLDGATWDVLLPMAEDGLVPHLKRLLDGAAWGPLLAPFPPVTAPSWTTFQTGVNPGRHGVFDFFELQPRTYRKSLAELGPPPVPSLWNHVASAGGRSVVINLPSVASAEPFPGHMVPGMLTRERHPVGPPEMTEALERELGPYVLDVDWPGGDEAGVAPYLDRLEEAVHQRGKWAEALLEREDWSLGIVVFVAPDRIQHKTFGAVSPGSQSPHAERARQVFARLDAEVGRLVDAAGADAHIMLVSDHGFGRAARVFEPNVHLANHGLLGRHTGRLAALSLAKKVRRAVTPMLPSVSHRAAPGGLSGGRAAHRVVDWSRTRAFALSTTDMGIYVNDSTRFPQGTVHSTEERESVLREVEAALDNLHDPATGEAIPVQTMRRESIYDGPFLEGAPDLLFVVDDGAVHCGTRVDGPAIHSADFLRGDGNHRREGIFAIRSTAATPGAMPPLAMEDIAPSILHLLGVSGGDSMDGVIPPWLSAERPPKLLP